MVTFKCPYCGEILEGEEEDNGRTLECPMCGLPVTLQVVDSKVVAATVVGLGLRVLPPYSVPTTERPPTL
jgi:DNA-directed RNA polymerase subunit RPC12/RpoP